MKWQFQDDLAEEFLKDDDKLLLLRLARETLRCYLGKKRKETPSELGIALTENVRVEAGAFVTLHKGGNLRGCIGEIHPERPLCDVIQDHALNSGLRDPRFRPVVLSELNDIVFEISVLTPPQAVDSWQDIEVGKDGVVLHKEGRSAVFLPQVATEQGWDVREMLMHLSLKAGLGPDDWRQGATFEVFQAIVFSEKSAS